MSKNKKHKTDVPEYLSGDEEEEEVRCSLCHEVTDDLVQYGKWITLGKINVHHLCCVSFNCIDIGKV